MALTRLVGPHLFGSIILTIRNNNEDLNSPSNLVYSRRFAF